MLLWDSASARCLLWFIQGSFVSTGGRSMFFLGKVVEEDCLSLVHITEYLKRLTVLK